MVSPFDHIHNLATEYATEASTEDWYGKLYTDINGVTWKYGLLDEFYPRTYEQLEDGSWEESVFFNVPLFLDMWNKRVNASLQYNYIMWCIWKRDNVTTCQKGFMKYSMHINIIACFQKKRK